jgi:hypothetical protein
LSGKIGGVIIKKSATLPRPVPPFARLPFSFRSAQRDGILSGYFAIGRFLTIGSRVAEGYHAFQPSKATLGNPSARFERQNSRPAAPASLLTVKTLAGVAQPNFQPSKPAISRASRSFDRRLTRKNVPNQFYFNYLRKNPESKQFAVGRVTPCAPPLKIPGVRRAEDCPPYHVFNHLAPFPLFSQISSAAEAVRGFAT